MPHAFTWYPVDAEIILLGVRWEVRYALRSRDLEEILLERGLRVDHTPIDRWVQCSAPEREKRSRPHLKALPASWRVDETSVKIKGIWMEVYRAVDAQGKTVEFHLSPPRDPQAAKPFFAKAVGASHIVTARVSPVDKNAASPNAFGELKATGAL